MYICGHICMEYGGCDPAVAARIISAWKSFVNAYPIPILTGKGFSLKLKGKILV